MENKLSTLVFVSALILTGFFLVVPEVLASNTNESVMYPDSYQNSDAVNPERYTPSGDDLSRFVHSEDMEAKDSVVEEDYVYYLNEDGEVEVEPISGVAIDYKGKVSYWYGGYEYIVGDFSINGEQAYCLEHDNDTPGDGSSNDGGNPYNDPEIQACLYYGWGGQGQIDFDSRNQGIVVTSLVLDELYTNQNNTGAISNCPQYKELENLARNATAPTEEFDFTDTTLTTTVSGNTQTSQTTKMNGAVENKVSFKIPSEVTFHNKTTGHTQKGGTVTIKGGDSFYFTAPSNYEPDYNSGSLKGTIRPVNPIVVKMDNSSLQDLGYAPYADSPPQSGFTVQFKDYSRTITVNHIDDRTGELITKETYTKNQGDSYTYYPKDNLKVDGVPYTPIEGTTPVSGTVGTSDITINFYYTAPVVKVGLDYVKIPTALASEGIDVYVKLILDDVYDSEMTDTVNPKFTLSIYEGSTKIASKEIAPATFDATKEVILHVPSSLLNVNEKNTYTVKIEGYDSKDVYVTAKEIVIDGYTASEETIVVNASTTQQNLTYEGVVGTYEKYGQAQQTAYENFEIPNIKQLGKEKSGFGFELPMTFSYYFTDPTGQFANEITPPELTMNVPNEIVDTTYIAYETDGTTSKVPFDSSEMSDTQQHYQLPHVWCEEMTGALFTDEQVKNGDERITEDLIDGGHKFYTPIWCDLGQYPITVTNEEPIGANEVNIEINYVLDIYAQMYGTVDSETIEHDHIIWRPVDVHNPFPEGMPDNWTEEDVEWLTSNNFVW